MRTRRGSSAAGSPWFSWTCPGDTPCRSRRKWRASCVGYVNRPTNAARIVTGGEAGGVPVAGIAYMPAAGDLFAAVQGHGTTHNGVPVHVSKLSPLADATVTHGCLQQFTDSGVGEALVRLAGACDSARGYPDFDGYRQVLLGRSDAMVDPGVQPYDICAPAVLIREAGGRFTSLQGEETIYGGSAIASNGVIHDELVAALSATPYP